MDVVVAAEVAGAVGEAGAAAMPPVPPPPMPTSPQAFRPVAMATASANGKNSYTFISKHLPVEEAQV
jgi:hypothetical protein